MGKVKDEQAAPRASKPASKGGGSKSGRRVHPFVSTLFGTGQYKPMQGRQARRATFIALAAILLAGVWRLFQATEGLEFSGALAGYELYVRYAVAGLLAAALAWVSWRLVQYPPFADFLVATQAEMNKVSWISRDDLKRATAVVLVTVALLSFFLFGIDQVWIFLLRTIDVLKVASGAGGEVSG